MSQLSRIALLSELNLSLRLSAYAALFKVRLTALVVITSVLGYFIAAEQVFWGEMIALIMGGFLVTGASNTFNQVLEVDTDALMDRTNQRPLVLQLLSRMEALWVASLSALAGVLLLWFVLNPLTGVLALLSLFVYVAIYTPMKKITPWAVFVGAFPGAIPPMLGYVAASGSFSLEPGILFAVQFMWQFPHFWAIAWKVNQDYNKAGFYLLPAKSGKSETSAFIILIYTIFLIPVSLLPVMFHFSGMTSSIFYLIAGFLMLYPAIQLFRKQTDKAAKQLMFASFVYMPIVLIAWLIDKI
jgi:protoheme IX farnesyltransferase